MSLTIDCGEGKHDICSGLGTDAYLIPQLAGERFNCGCACHHNGRGVPCPDCIDDLGRVTAVARRTEEE